jgi:predicted DNA-binding transcriptional regulator AlpA
VERNLRGTTDGTSRQRIATSVRNQSVIGPGQPAASTTTLPEAGFVRIRQILAVYPIGRSTWWAGVKSGRFPRPVKLGPRTTAWRVEDIRRLIK